MSESSSFSARQRWLLAGGLALGLGAALWFFVFRSPPPPEHAVQPAWAGTEWPYVTPVRTVRAQQLDLPVQLKAIGTVTPLATVTVRSRVDGELMRVAFEEGQWIEQGQLLAEVDPATYRIKLAQAEGDQRQNFALAETARADLARFRQLFAQNLVTNQQLEAQQSLVAEREGALATDEALVAEARLQLAYTRIEAPIAGRLGLRQMDPGNLVRASDTKGLVVITQTRPISIVFTVPEIDLAKVIEPYRAGEALAVEAWDRSEQHQLATGVLKTVDNQIDLTTGTLKLKAEFANADETLFPNQFVNVRLRVRTLANAVVIPSAAVQFGARGTYVYVVTPESLAQVRDVKLGPVDGTQQAVLSGVQAGDAVVLEGLDRLRDGRKVLVQNEAPAGGAVAAPAQR